MKKKIFFDKTKFIGKLYINFCFEMCLQNLCPHRRN